jgi:DNA helicase IV
MHTSLNPQQQKAVASQNKRLLILAGAGSGKTKTLLQKVIHLIDIDKVKASQIMAITFTKNAANEMIDRLIVGTDSGEAYEKILSDKKLSSTDKHKYRLQFKTRYRWIDALTLRTFHSFCYSVLRSHGAKEFDNQFRIVSDTKVNEADDLAKFSAPETSFEIMHKLIIESCEEVDYLLMLKRYILDFAVDKIHLQKKDYKGQVYNNKYYTTLDGNKVRSKSEQYIADWMYRYSIPYEYEPLLNISDFEFKPDFYIPQANLYIEHISDKSAPMRSKEEQFEKGNLLLVKTYEEQTNNSAEFNHILEQIIKGRLPENYTKSHVLTFKEALNGFLEQVRDVVKTSLRITDMVKVEEAYLDDIYAKSQQDQHERVRIFYKIVTPVIGKYIAYCINKSYLDFNDMISTCIQLFKNYPDILDRYRKQYDYILVDEFQDVNNLQVELLQLLLKKETQLFCVGDDWQSIYGFRGSNVNYIVNFENHFIDTETIALDINYRSSESIVGASNEVIKNNKVKVDKDIKASKRSEHKIVVHASEEEAHAVEYCIKRIYDLQAEGYGIEDILFLYRRSKMYSPYFDAFRKEGIKVAHKTIHAAKGLEAKAVFIIGLSEGKGGFPDIWLEDRLFQVIKQADHDVLMEEERRLFYVAITRAKDKLFLITQRGNESSFLKEIPELYTVSTQLDAKIEATSLQLCNQCFSQLQKLWKVCPYCGLEVMR